MSPFPRIRSCLLLALLATLPGGPMLAEESPAKTATDYYQDALPFLFKMQQIGAKQVQLVFQQINQKLDTAQDGDTEAATQKTEVEKQMAANKKELKELARQCLPLLDKAEKLEPENFQIAIAKYTVYVLTFNREKIDAYGPKSKALFLASIQKTAPDPEELGLVYGIYLKEQDFQGFLELLDTLEKKYPDNPQLLTMIQTLRPQAKSHIERQKEMDKMIQERMNAGEEAP